jgi:hypothetical protein
MRRPSPSIGVRMVRMEWNSTAPASSRDASVPPFARRVRIFSARLTAKAADAAPPNLFFAIFRMTWALLTVGADRYPLFFASSGPAGFETAQRLYQL